MSAGLVTCVTLAYLGVAFDQVCKGRLDLALVWTGYAIANIGMIWGFARG